MIQARFAPDGKAIVYSAKLNGTPIDTYVVREDYPEPVPAGLHGAALLGVSRQGQMAVLVRPQYWAHRQYVGTLATAPISGGAPRELLENVRDADWSPDGNELAVIDRDRVQFRVQYPLGKVLLEGPNWLTDIRVSPDGEKVALFRHPPNIDDRGDVIVVDRSGKLRSLSSGWESLEGLTWSPSGKEIWFSAAESGEQYCIRAVSLVGQQRTVYCGLSPTMIHDALPSGRVLVVSEEYRAAMTMVEHGSGAERDLSWLDLPYGPRLSRDGSLVLFTDQSEHGGNGYSVYVRKSDGSPAVRIGGNGFATDLSPDGKWALVVLPGDPAARVQVVPVGPGQTRSLHWDGVMPLWATWFPDGQHILLESSSAGQGYGFSVTDAKGTTPKLLVIAGDTLAPISSNGQGYMVLQNGSWTIQPIPEGAAKPVPGLQPDELPIGWASGLDQIFTQLPTSTGLTISKISLNSATANSGRP